MAAVTWKKYKVTYDEKMKSGSIKTHSVVIREYLPSRAVGRIRGWVGVRNLDSTSNWRVEVVPEEEGDY